MGIISWQEWKERLRRGYETRMARSLIVSYPKSGRTWLRAMMGRAICRGFNLDESLLLDTFRLTKAARLTPTTFTHDGGSNKEGRHLSQLKKDKSCYRRKRVLLLVRDPRDVVVSCYFQATKRNRVFQGSLSEFIRCERRGFRKILHFHRLWEANQETPTDFVLLRYEDMRADTAAALRYALRFIGWDEPAESLIADSVEFARFENMKAMERDGYFSEKILRPRKAEDEESYKVRRGKIGGYRDYLNACDSAYLEDALAAEGCAFYPDLTGPGFPSQH